MLKMDATRTAARRRRTRGALLGVGLALGLAAPASAQWFGGFEAERPLPPQGVTRMLAARGFTDVSWPRFDGEVYTVEGTNRSGDRVRLTIDAYDGDIVGRRRLARADDPFGYAPVPPRDVGRGPVGPEGPIAGLDPLGPTEMPRASGPQPTPRSMPQARKPVGPRPVAHPAEATPAQPAPPPAPAPVAASKPQAPAKNRPAATTVATRSATPVRIIGGVTPLNPNQPGTAQQAAAEPPETPPL